MAVIQVSVAMAVIPLSIGLLIWGVDRGDLFPQMIAVGMFIVGMTSWYASLQYIKKEQKESKQERDRLLGLIENVGDELKGFRQDIKDSMERIYGNAKK